MRLGVVQWQAPISNSAWCKDREGLVGLPGHVAKLHQVLENQYNPIGNSPTLPGWTITDSITDCQCSHIPQPREKRKGIFNILVSVTCYTDICRKNIFNLIQYFAFCILEIPTNKMSEHGCKSKFNTDSY